MDFGLIALVAVIAREVLHFVAKRTKNKVDDKIDAAAQKFPLPSLADAMKALGDKPAGKTTMPSGAAARDHRTK